MTISFGGEVGVRNGKFPGKVSRMGGYKGGSTSSLGIYSSKSRETNITEQIKNHRGGQTSQDPKRRPQARVKSFGEKVCNSRSIFGDIENVY